MRTTTRPLRGRGGGRAEGAAVVVVGAWLGGKRWVSAKSKQEGEGRIREGGEGRCLPVSMYVCGDRGWRGGNDVKGRGNKKKS